VAAIRSVEEIDPKLNQRFILDSNIVIQFLDKDNLLHDQVRSKMNELFIAGVQFYYPAPALLEIKNYWRLKELHDSIQYAIDNGFNFFSDFQKHFTDIAPMRRRKNRYLNDNDVKELRSLLEKVHNNKGIVRWFQLCDTALKGKMSAIDQTLKNSNIRYTNFGDEEIFLSDEKSEWPKWGTANNLIEKYALASNDAAILNMAFAKRIDGIISNDKDLVFAVKNGAYPSDKLFYTFLK